MPTKRGFTLIELLIVIAILAILAVMVVNLINPLELVRRARDADRLSDLSYLRSILAVRASEDSTIGYCYNTTIPCQESTYPLSSNTRNNNGSGWIKVDFSSMSATLVPILPIDPINSSDQNYVYNSNGTLWEINTILESEKYKDLMIKDGGNNDNKYEVGTKLDLLN